MKKGLILLLSILLLSSFVIAADPLGSGSASVTFSGGIDCVRTSSNSYWVLSNFNEIVFNSSGNVGNCSEYYDSSLNGTQKCCPLNYDCNSAGSCVVSNVTPVLIGCARYTNAVDCNSDPNRVAFSTVETRLNKPGICNPSNQVDYQDPVKGNCLNYSVCSCVWHVSNSSCGHSYQANSYCEGFPEVKDTCNWVAAPIDNLCDSEGRISVNYVASGNALGKVMSGGVICADTQTDYPCSASLKLPFFDWFNFILAGLFIAGVYFVSSRRH